MSSEMVLGDSMIEDMERSEWRDLTRGHVRHWLRQVVRLRHKVANHADMVAELRETATSLGAMDYSRVQVKTSPSADGIPNAVIRLWEKIDEGLADVEEYVDELDRVQSCLDSMSNQLSARIIRLHYIDEMEYSEVMRVLCAEGRNYSEVTVKRLCGSGLDELYWLMPHEYRVQVQPAI